MRSLIILVLYIGVGFAAHAVLIGGDIDLMSAWSLAAILGWPIPFGLFCSLLLCVVFLGFMAVEVRDRRKLARQAREHRKRAHDRARRHG